MGLLDSQANKRKMEGRKINFREKGYIKEKKKRKFVQALLINNSQNSKPRLSDPKLVP